MIYKITKEQIDTLGVFLGRVSLKWNEVASFNDLLKALSSPIQEEAKEVKEVPKKTK